MGKKEGGVGKREEKLLDKLREELEGRVSNGLKEALGRQREANEEALRKQREVLEAEARKAVVVRNRGILAEKIKLER